MIEKINKRTRCDVIHCRSLANYGMGKKSIQFVLCENHYRELVNDIIKAEFPSVSAEEEHKEVEEVSVKEVSVSEEVKEGKTEPKRRRKTSENKES